MSSSDSDFAAGPIGNQCSSASTAVGKNVRVHYGGRTKKPLCAERPLPIVAIVGASTGHWSWLRTCGSDAPLKLQAALDKQRARMGVTGSLKEWTTETPEDALVLYGIGLANCRFLSTWGASSHQLSDQDQLCVPALLAKGPKVRRCGALSICFSTVAPLPQPICIPPAFVVDLESKPEALGASILNYIKGNGHRITCSCAQP